LQHDGDCCHYTLLSILSETPKRWIWKKEPSGTIGQYCYTDSGLYRAGAGVVSLDKLANKYNYYRVYAGMTNIYYIHKCYLPDKFVQPEDIWSSLMEKMVAKEAREISIKK
jgi:hypothetical protein